MKKTLVKMELGKFYDSEFGTLVVRPSGVEPKYDGDDAFKSEITDDYPHIPITKEFRDKAVLDKVLNGGKVVATQVNGGKDPSYLEFGIESIENKTFTVMGMTISQEIQRWFLNIYSLNNDSVLFTSHNIEECLNTLNYYLIDNDLSQVAINDFIEKLTTDENLKFIEKITAEPKQKKKEWVHRTLQSIENCEALQHNLIAWLGNQISQFVEDFNEACDECEDMKEVYAFVDKTFHPKNIYFFRELERMLEWVNSDYDPRCLTDEAIRCINGGLDELAKQCLEKLCKKVGNDHVGGWYLHDTEENKNKYISHLVELSDDAMDFIDDCGYVMFLDNLNSALNRLGYRIDQILDVQNDSDWKRNVPQRTITLVLECINPQKAL